MKTMPGLAGFPKFQLEKLTRNDCSATENCAECEAEGLLKHKTSTHS